MDSTLLQAVCTIAEEAAAAIMEVYAQPFAVERKDDASPVTEADERANALIVARLEKLTPDIPVISEEAGEHPELPAGTKFWLVDPLDGTKSFIARDGQFTVNIALVEGGIAKLGVMVLPARGDVYAGIIGQGAWRTQPEVEGRQEIRTREPSPEGYDVVVSKAHESPKMDAFLADIPVRRRVKAGSALKLARVAEGRADLYPRLGPTMEWDTAAGQAILEAAGGVMTDLQGNPFRYGKPGYLNSGFIASGAAFRQP